MRLRSGLATPNPAFEDGAFVPGAPTAFSMWHREATTSCAEPTKAIALSPAPHGWGCEEEATTRQLSRCSASYLDVLPVI
mmetsp:Transcript_17842/g.39928  ORF Transcript_17842/g.39928 Transcript_17842/m.39928 type:complete len:80 (+) Transcript_17842:505-744(+)